MVIAHDRFGSKSADPAVRPGIRPVVFMDMHPPSRPTASRLMPDRGEIDYAHIFRAIAELGYDAPLGAEYRPTGDTDATLGWLGTLG